MGTHRENMDNDTFSPEEEAQILKEFQARRQSNRRASEVERRNSSQWLETNDSAITRSFDMKAGKMRKPSSEKIQVSTRRASVEWMNNQESVLTKARDLTTNK